jgi:predicted ATPase
MWPISRAPQWVGRTPELAVLRAAAEALHGGEGAVVWVEGEPGIGKSSLVAEALNAMTPARMPICANGGLRCSRMAWPH